MLYNTVAFAAMALFSAKQAIGSPIEPGSGIAKPHILIATDACKHLTQSFQCFVAAYLSYWFNKFVER